MAGTPQAGAPAGSGMPQPSREQQAAMAAMSPEQRQQTIRNMVEGLAVRLKDNPQDRAGWLRLANAWKVLGESGNAVDAYAKADALAPVDARVLSDWAEAHVRGLAEDLAREDPGLVPLQRVGGELLLHPAPRHLAERLVILGEGISDHLSRLRLD